MATLPATSDRLSPRHAIVLLLIGISIFINFVDRGNLAIAAPSLKDELSLNASQLGLLLSAFFWTYAIFQLVSGWLVDRFDASWVLAAGFFLWSAATAFTGIVHQFAALLVMRFVLGIGESVAYPSYSKILAEHLPENQRGRANGVITAGVSCGPAFGMFFGALLMERFGWRAFFVGLGLGGLLWLVPWLRWKLPAPFRTSAATVPLSVFQFLRLRAAWGTCGGLFAVNYVSYFFITWMPYYLLRERNFSMSKMGTVAGGSYLAAAASALVCGRLADRWITAGASPTRVRKTFTGAGLLGTAIFLVACPLTPPNLSIFMLVGAATTWAACGANLWAITYTLAGTAAAGRWTGIQNCIGNFSGIIAPVLTGFVLDRTGKFFWPFLITAGVAIFGVVSYVFILEAVEQVSWVEAQ